MQDNNLFISAFALLWTIKQVRLYINLILFSVVKRFIYNFALFPLVAYTLYYSFNTMFLFNRAILEIFDYLQIMHLGLIKISFFNSKLPFF